MKTKQQKRSEAAERQEFWDQLKPKAKLKDLDTRLGKNVGAEKQRGRLIAQIEGDLEKAMKLALSYSAGPRTFDTIKRMFETPHVEIE